MINILSWLKDTFTSRISDQDIEALQDSVKVLNYELSLLRYKDSDDEDIRLAIEYLKKRPLSDALFPYELVSEIPPVEVRFDKDRKMCYVLHNGRPLYFPKREDPKLVRAAYRYSLAYDDILGNGYRERSPHACQSPRFHIEEGDVLIDAGGWTIFDRLDDSADEALDDVLDVLLEEALDKVKAKVGKGQAESAQNEGIDIWRDLGTARGLLALDVIDKVSKVYLVERTSRWRKPLKATFAPYDKVELVKGFLSGKKKGKKKKGLIGLADLLEKCGHQRVFVMMDLEGKELEVLRDAKEYLRTARNPITLAVCAYHRTTDYDDLMEFFEEIGYQTETQPGYIYTDMNDGHGIHSLRHGLVRASNIKQS
jgi:hypothetical protein